jgi:hypothetical protein
MNWKLCACLFALAGCEAFRTEKDDVGELRIAFADLQEELTRTVSEIPDTCDFLISVTDSKGNVIYDGLYGDCPETFSVDSGNYVVKAVSRKFDEPEFSAPQYGDEQLVVVPSGGSVGVRLLCCQMNAGVRLRIAKSFLTGCPDGVLFLKSDHGTLMYGYSEKRTAYFHPGNVTLMLSRSGKDETLLTRAMEAQQMLVLGVSVAPSYSSDTKDKGSISVLLDTARVWISEDYIIGGSDGKGSGADRALTVNQALSSVGEKEVWVSGYIVGGDLTSSSASFEKPFSSRTCLVLGPRASTRDRSSCMSVQLPAGKVREALNLVDNPGLLGCKVTVRGDIVQSYYGLVGLKNITDYNL